MPLSPAGFFVELDSRGEPTHDPSRCFRSDRFACPRCRGELDLRRDLRQNPGQVDRGPAVADPTLNPFHLVEALKYQPLRRQLAAAIVDLIADDVGELVGELVAELLKKQSPPPAPKDQSR